MELYAVRAFVSAHGFVIARRFCAAAIQGPAKTMGPGSGDEDEMSENRISLGVFRDLENRRLNQSDNGPLAVAAHEKRKVALEHYLSQPPFVVIDWGDTRSTSPHEYVQLAIDFLSHHSVADLAAIPGAVFVGEILSDTFKSILADGLKRLVVKLAAGISRREIEDAHITLPDGSQISVRPGGHVYLSIKGQAQLSFQFDDPPRRPSAP